MVCRSAQCKEIYEDSPDPVLNEVGQPTTGVKAGSLATPASVGVGVTAGHGDFVAPLDPSHARNGREDRRRVAHLCGA